MRRTCLFLASRVAMLAAGCYSPDGGLMPSTGRGFVYQSTPMQPTTVSLIDTRTQEAFFSMDIPPGKQLQFNFLSGGGDDPVYTPDRMVYAVWEIGNQIGTLDNQLTCPPASCRRIDVTFRKAPEWSTPDNEVRLRTDEAADRPPYFTPKGGQLPEAGGKYIYDK